MSSSMAIKNAGEWITLMPTSTRKKRHIHKHIFIKRQTANLFEILHNLRSAIHDVLSMLFSSNLLSFWHFYFLWYHPPPMFARPLISCLFILYVFYSYSIHIRERYVLFRFHLQSHLLAPCQAISCYCAIYIYTHIYIFHIAYIHISLSISLMMTLIKTIKINTTRYLIARPFG